MWLMGWGATKTVIAAFAFCLAAGAMLSVALAGCGGEAKPTSDEVNAAYLQLAKHTREYTFTIDRATEDPPDRPGQLARRFKSFAESVNYTATFLLTPLGIGPVLDKGLVFQHSLGIYESVLRSVTKLARSRSRSRARDRALERTFRWVRQTEAEARIAGAAWERALRAAIAE